MNPITLYGIYEATRDNKALDLTIGLAMFQAEHPDVTISHEEDKAIREFIGKHSKELADGFAKGFDAFAETVAACEIEDAEGAGEN